MSYTSMMCLACKRKHTVNRRLNSIKRDPVYFFSLTLLCALFHFSVYVGDYFNFYLYPLALMCIAFIGYKYGRFNVLFAVLLNLIIFLTIKYLYFDALVNLDKDFSPWFSSYFDLSDEIEMVGQSLSDFLLLAVFGLITTFAIEWIEQRAKGVKLTFDQLLPYNHYFFLKSIVNFCERWLTIKPVDAEVNAEFNIDLPYGVKVNLRILLKRALFGLSIPLLFIFSLNHELEIELTDYPFTPSFFPDNAGIVLILVFCWFRGFTQTAWLLTLFFAGSLMYLFSTEGGDITDQIYTIPIFFDVGHLALSLVLAWWLDKAKMAWSNPRLKCRLFRLPFFRGIKARPHQTGYFPFGAVPLLLLLSLPVQFQLPTFETDASDGSTEVINEQTALDSIIVEGADSFESDQMSYNPVLVLLIFVLAFCKKYNPYSISNVLLIILSIQSCLRLSSDILFDEQVPVVLTLFSNDMMSILLLSMVPVCYRFLELNTVPAIRRFLWVYSAILLMYYWVISSFKNVFVIRFGDDIWLTLLALGLHLMAIELLARGLIQYQQRSTPLVH
jgi:hypothetical protein